MAAAFTPAQRESIREALLNAALKCLPETGMQRITVDELAHGAGISKGAFYRFFESKEHLFLVMLNHLHERMYARAQRILDTCIDVPMRQRTMLAIREIYEEAHRSGAVAFVRHELSGLLRRLPERLVRESYISDEMLIEKLISRSGVQLKTDMPTACAAIRVLLLALLFENEIGPGFESAMRLMIEGACERILA